MGGFEALQRNSARVRPARLAMSARCFVSEGKRPHDAGSGAILIRYGPVYCVCIGRFEAEHADW